MNIFRDFTQRVQHALKQIEIDGTDWDSVDLSRVVVEPPRDAAHGDLATNAAMVLAKNLGMKPRDLAEKLTAVLASDSDIEGTNVAGPGFVNIKLKSDFWTTHLVQILKSGDGYGKNYVEAPRKVNVEYVSANPTGPMHVGHCRGAVVGDAIAALLEFAGHDVTREYYINDAGSQINVLAQSVYLRYCEALGEDIGQIPEGLYPGDYLVPLGKELAEKHGESLKEMPEEERSSLLKEAAIDGMMDLIRADLAQLNVHHDLFFSERTLHADAGNGSAISATVSGLRDRGLVYDGTLPPPKGKLPDDWEDREQTLFKATDFGDDIDRPLAKSDGSYTYFAADVAYFRDKYERGFQDMLFILGADHGGYVKRLQAVCKAIAGDEARLSVLLCQLVKLMRAGEPVKMSKRSGNLITLRDVVDEVGVDPVRFMMLNRKSDAPLDFDFEKVTEQSKDNPVFYVQYAHARCKSIFRQAKEELGSDFEQLTSDLSVLSNEELAELSHESELQLIQKMAAFPRLIETAAEAREPHRLAFYLYDLASAFHGHWNKGKSEVGLRFINADNRNSTKVRLALVQAIANVLAIGLSILGVSAPEEMR